MFAAPPRLGESRVGFFLRNFLVPFFVLFVSFVVIRF